MSFTPQGPLVQKINAKFHTEPLATIAYGAYWIGIFIIAPIIVIPFMIVSTIRELVLQYLGKSNVTPIYDPKNQPEYDLAVVITGCDTGFGKDLAIYAANAGYTVFAACLSVEKSKKQFETFPKITPYQCNVTSDSEVSAGAKLVEEWVKDTNIPVQDVGRKRILFAVVNNAGIARSGEADTSDLKDFQEVMDVNCFGPIRVVKSFLPLLKEQAIQRSFSGNTTRIINVTSAAALVDTGVGSTTYYCAKHAAQSFTNNLRIELRPFNIAVSSVNPSFHTTPLVDNFALECSKLHSDKVPQNIRDEYGPEYFEGLLAATDIYTVWNPIVVVEEILYKGLMTKHPVRELHIGLDCKFLLATLFRMIPSYIIEPIVCLPRPIPACMKVQTAQTPSKTK